MNYTFIEPNPTMRVDGGIDTYSFEGKRYITDVPPLGRKVVYLNDNGYEFDREYANQYFSKGQVLTVKEIYVGRSSSKVEFAEVPDKTFNTVMFADLD